MMIDVATEAGALRFCELQRAEMTRIFRKKGVFNVNGFGLSAFVFLTHAVVPPDDPADVDAWRTGPPLSAVKVERVNVPPAAALLLQAKGKQEFGGVLMGETLRRYCKLGRAAGVLVMSEQWGGVCSDDERKHRPKRIEDWDDRRESLMMQLEHRLLGQRLWRAPIHRNPTRLAPWELRPKEHVVAGNLGRIMDTREWAS
jgi:hypothetical protein